MVIVKATFVGPELTLQLNKPFSMKGLPLCVLTGAGHAVPLTPLTATCPGVGVLILTFAEDVSDGDVLTWPNKDPAIRSFQGMWMLAGANLINADAPPVPAPTYKFWDLKTNQLFLTFDIPIEVNSAGFYLGSTYYNDEAGNYWIGTSVVQLDAYTLRYDLDWFFTRTGGVGIEAHFGGIVAAAFGGAQPTDLVAEPATESIPSGPPQPVAALTLDDHAYLTVCFRHAVTPVGAAVLVNWNDAGSGYSFNGDAGFDAQPFPGVIKVLTAGSIPPVFAGFHLYKLFADCVQDTVTALNNLETNPATWLAE